MTIETGVLLKEHTTFKTGGPADYFCRASSVADIQEAVAFATEKKLPFFILGGGSNVLAPDAGVRGIVINVAIPGVLWSENETGVEVTAGAGVLWDALVAESVARDLYGFENLSKIPGTVGGTPVQNVGAYGTEVKDTIISVEVFDTRAGEVRTLANEECAFGYRDSLFKTAAGKDLIVTRVTYQLSKNGKVNIGYKDLREFFKDHNGEPTVVEVRDAVAEIRGRKFPDLANVGTAGSFFKNPVIENGEFEALSKNFPEVPHYRIDAEHVKIPLAWILDVVCSIKGMRKGNVGLFERQPLVLVNYGGTTKEILALADEITTTVHAKTNLNISPEIFILKNTV